MHQTNAETVSRFGWNGENAWSEVEEGVALGTNPLFWPLTAYYLVGVPFVLADPDVTLAYKGEIDLEGPTRELVRAALGEGIGDAPDGLHVVLIDRETHRVGGVRYVVSYQGSSPGGGRTPEKVMLCGGAQENGGITSRQTFRTFVWGTEGEEGCEKSGPACDVVTNSYFSNVSFEPRPCLSSKLPRERRFKKSTGSNDWRVDCAKAGGVAGR